MLTRDHKGGARNIPWDSARPMLLEGGNAFLRRITLSSANGWHTRRFEFSTRGGHLQSFRSGSSPIVNIELMVLTEPMDCAVAAKRASALVPGATSQAPRANFHFAG
jgi:hypothetical protein